MSTVEPFSNAQAAETNPLANAISGRASIPSGRHFLAGDIVKDKSLSFSPESHNECWRVGSYLKRVEDTLLDSSASTGNKMRDRTREVVRKRVLEQQQRRIDKGLPATRRYRYQWCTPQEATHISCSGVCGNIIAIEDAIFVEVVNWTQDQINEEQNAALCFVGEFTDYEWE